MNAHKTIGYYPAFGWRQIQDIKRERAHTFMWKVALACAALLAITATVMVG